ncbi:MAG TPA: amino acid ABC transporter substrate-binding protein [Actinophytocola sp.]|uniref:amino acid ABC transporter substrate-binding protein n=1 Tax=Actinophytocola sp. TaxID=1872138 RepID=UPI002DDD647D|nr:amino acid ABC transporter substrate-binding protein [Actinophytocola sp.]HEV2782522.1 amino acid ABC transporter substrate-binding protein [Actinophytocola sp.]
MATVLLLAITACESKSESDGEGAPAASTEPIVVGSTLSLSGAFAATGAIHKIAGEQFVARLNAKGGLLGRQVQWVVRDDESDQAKVSTLYEQLISQERVDLIIGPYATPNILSAMAVAQRHGYTMPHHTSVLAPLMTYECQFPGWSIGPKPNEFVPNQLFDAVASLPNPPKKVAILTNQNGSTDFVSYGSQSDQTGAVSIAKQRGLTVAPEIRYPPSTTDWAPLAAQVRDAAPDLVINHGLGVDPVNLLQAMAQLGYKPPLMFSLFPAPGPPLGLGPAAEGLLSVTIFEPNKSTLDKLGKEATEIVEEFKTRATDAKLPYTVFETQAAASWTAWEILVAAVERSGGLDQKAMCDKLHSDGADTTFNGHLDFDPAVHNFWRTTQQIKQIQSKDWVTVWPADRAAAKLQGPPAA